MSGPYTLRECPINLVRAIPGWAMNDFFSEPASRRRSASSRPNIRLAILESP